MRPAGVVFDGFPRTLPQAEQLDRILDKRGFGKPVVIEFCVAEDDLIRRLSGRRTCSVGGEIYNLVDAPPKVDGICDRDGGKLSSGRMIAPEVVKDRLRAYERQTKPLAEYYRKQDALDEVDASKEHGRSEPCAHGNYEACGRAEWSSVSRAAELEKMHRAGLVVWGALDKMRDMVRPGLATKELDEFAEAWCVEHKARPAFKGYRGYPGSVCTSINQEVVHGIPSGTRRVREGDILSLDFGVELDGYFGDAALTVPVGKISPQREKLLRVTRESLERAIEKVRSGNRLGDVSSAVQKWVEQEGFSVVREFVGHGIGTKMHEEPQVPNYGPAGQGPQAPRRHGSGHRAHGECGSRGCAGSGRRMDRSDGGRQRFGAF